MKKDKIKNIVLVIVVAIISSTITSYSVANAFDSSNVCYQVDSNTSASVQDTIDDLYGRASDFSAKQNANVGTANKALISNSSGNIAVSNDIDTTELGYLNGVTSNIQTQLDGKLSNSPAGIEFTGTSGTNVGGVVDFHYNGSTSDYTSRIYEDASGRLKMVASNGVYLNGRRLSAIAVSTVSGTEVTVNAGATAWQTINISSLGAKSVLSVTPIIYNNGVFDIGIQSVSSTSVVIGLTNKQTTQYKGTPSIMVCYVAAN